MLWLALNGTAWARLSEEAQRFIAWVEGQSYTLPKDLDYLSLSLINESQTISTSIKQARIRTVVTDFQI